jgi:proteic killer suppression protein
MLLSFADKDTEKLAGLQGVRKFRNFERIALRKLTQLDIAATLEDLQIPPGNRLELLSGNRKGQYAIRINDQFRICFIWTKNGPQDVEITDYH